MVQTPQDNRNGAGKQVQVWVQVQDQMTVKQKDKGTLRMCQLTGEQRGWCKYCLMRQK